MVGVAGFEPATFPLCEDNRSAFSSRPKIVCDAGVVATTGYLQLYGNRPS